jgi:Tfp pilus assembly protein PilN
MSQVNLLPPEILERQKTRRTALMIMAGGAVVGALVFGFYFMKTQELSDVQEQISAQSASNSQIEGEIADLQRFEDLEVEAQRREELLSIAYASEVSLSGLLMDVSRVIPDDSYLASLSAVVTPPITDPTLEGGAAPSFFGNLALAGEARGFKTLSILLSRMEQVRGWVNPWMSTITQSTDIKDAYGFSATVDLNEEVVTARGKSGETGDGGEGGG